MNNKELNELPFAIDFETKKVLKSLPAAHAALAELKVTASTIHNQDILINTLTLREAKDSSAIENIITTYDELYKSELNFDSYHSPKAKKVQNYNSALKKGLELCSKSGSLTNKTILKIHEILEENKEGFRKSPSTIDKNANRESNYTPPQSHDEIVHFMTNLEQYIQTSEINKLDPLIKMAIIQYQLESIHPFYEGSGRIGRIINLLYLINEKVQQIPILFLSSYIIRHQED